MFKLLALNALKDTDIIFFVALAAIVVLAVAIYFLIPVFNRKQYREQRDNLKKREVAFKSNLQSNGVDLHAEELPSEEQADVQADLPEQADGPEQTDGQDQTK